MKAVGFRTSLPITEKESFIDFETEKPSPKGYELLVKISAVSVNPVDFKIRQSAARDKVLPTPKIIGWDAVGIVESVGDKASLFKPGDRVYYSGDLTKQGCNAEYQVIDERIVGKAPKTWTDVQAAVIPLTGLTAWEILFDRMRITDKDRNKTILIIGGAGGVGSIAIQLAKKVAGLKVIATASRPETEKWCKDLGADVVVNHKDLVNNVRAAHFQQVDFIVDFVDANFYWEAMAELIKPQGHIASITGSSQPVPLIKLKNKSVSFSWELMYTRSMFTTEDIQAQHEILNQLADLIDNGVIKNILNTTLEGLTAETFKTAHRKLETSATIGKIGIKF